MISKLIPIVLIIVLMTSAYSDTNYKWNMRTVDKITGTVGKPFLMHVDVANNGDLDSYNVMLSAANSRTVEISPANVITDLTSSGGTATAVFSITPLTEGQNVITVTVKSVNCVACAQQSVDVPMSSGVFSLPEFGIQGFIQIMILASFGYLILIRRNDHGQLTEKSLAPSKLSE